jgi:hypothetical protein
LSWYKALHWKLTAEKEKEEEGEREFEEMFEEVGWRGEG